ncbi:MAG: hypothetical protein EXX96DRAFT_562241 [Benjaminiella poitrasii]|nr:MAG: hypothetical protein EXX96DRAFT_562241 [Benjaminiella poitrasii]
MASAKLIQISKDIDSARCNGNWTVISDLARRYKKYNPEGTVFEQTVLAEAGFIQTMNTLRSNTINTNDFENDSPGHVSIKSRLESQHIKPYQMQLIAAIQLSDPTNTNKTQKEFAKIILARTYFECGEYEKALEIISKLSFEKDSVSQGYSFVLFLQARAMKAICFEFTENEANAIQSYQGVEELLSENANIKYKTLIEWSEEALYRAILLGLKEDSLITIPSLLELMRQYQKITSTQAPLWCVQKRIVITRLSLEYISAQYRQGQYSPPSGSYPEDAERDSCIERQMFIVEQTQLHTIYEKMLYTVTPLPKAGQVNTHVLEFIDQFAKDFELIGTTAYDLRGFVEVLDRASQKTFNSPLITRHLFLALVRLGEFEEAEHALHSYLYLVGLATHGWKETRQESQALVTDARGVNMPVPISRPDVETAEDSEQILPVKRESILGDISEIKSTEKEEVEDTLHVLVTAVKMYCNELSRSVDAVEVAEIAKELYQKQNPRMRKTVLLDIGASVYRALGAAYGFLGRQTFDPDLRPAYHEKALSHLKYSLELKPDIWETYYQVALQEAEMRNIGQAVQFITQAIHIHPTHIVLWHLLTLLISCPVQGDYRQALKTCEIGLQQVQQDLTVEGENTFYGEDYSNTEQYILYQMTKTLLMHILEGPEPALAFSEVLFASFRKIAAPDSSTSSPSVYEGAHDGMVISGSLGNLSEAQLVSDQKRRGRSASSSMVAPQHQQQLQAYLNNSVVSSVSTSRIGTTSQDNVSPYNNGALVAGRARSASNLAANNNDAVGQGEASGAIRTNNNQHLTVPGNNEVKSHHHYHLHGLHLFGSKSSHYRNKGVTVQQQTNSIYNNLQNPAIAGNFSIQSLSMTTYDTKSIGTNSAASIHSVAPSIMSVQSILQPKNIPTKSSTRTLLRKEKSSCMLSNLWLLTAQIFIKLGKLDEAHKAVEEAESVNWTTNPQVWCVLGQLLQTQGAVEQAQAAFHKALVIDPNDVNSRLWLAKSYLEENNEEIAEGILDIITKSNGWDCAEAWFQLGEIYKNTKRLERTKDCFFYALELESTTSIQPFSILPRYL